MKKKQRLERIEEIKKILLNHGFTEDRFGHCKKATQRGRVFRFKFQPLVLRIEVQIDLHDGSKRWIKLVGSSYKTIKDEYIIEKLKQIGE